MTEKPLQEIKLDNGLVLRIYDESKPIAAERWLVRMAARMEIPTASVSFPRASENPQIAEVLGPVIVFEKKKERNFIAADKKDEVFRAMCDSFLKITRPYLSHPDFARKYVLRQYREQVAEKVLSAMSSSIRPTVPVTPFRGR